MRRQVQQRVLVASVLFVTGIALCLSFNQLNSSPYVGARRLSGSANHTEKCTSHENQLGLDLHVPHESKAFRVFTMFILVLYCFLGLAVVCDDFFQPSLEKISDVLSLSPDVAGATFLAAGSSAPELFTSFGDTFGPANNIGVGTIVGSAMFNILVIVALSAAAAEGTLKIDWRPVYRDVFFYSLSVTLFMVFAMDEHIYWGEALVMVICYLLYILLMKYNQRLFVLLDSLANGFCPSKIQLLNKKAEVSNSSNDAGIEVIQQAVLAIEDGTSDSNTGEGRGGSDSADVGAKEQDNPVYKGRDTGRKISISGVPSEVDKKNEQEEDEDGGRFDWPESLGGQIYFVFAFPWLCMFTVTIPDCENEKWENWYALAFGMSIVWIGMLCYIMVEAATQIGCELAIHPVVMGVLVLSIGTSVPDAIGSILAAKSGEADMAVANAIGSNVFDILLGLGLPWFCVTASGEKPSVKIDVGAMTTSVIILLSTVFLFLATLKLSNWQMNTRLGVALLILYGIYIVYTIADAVVNPK